MKGEIFKRYSSGSDVGQYIGWIEIDGMCVAFIDVDNRITWMEDLGLSPTDTKEGEPQPPAAIEAV